MSMTCPLDAKDNYIFILRHNLMVNLSSENMTILKEFSKKTQKLLQ